MHASGMQSFKLVGGHVGRHMHAGEAVRTRAPPSPRGAARDAADTHAHTALHVAQRVPSSGQCTDATESRRRGGPMRQPHPHM